MENNLLKLKDFTLLIFSKKMHQMNAALMRLKKNILVKNYQLQMFFTMYFRE